MIQGYTIEEKYITNKKILSIIKNLISENSYTALYYVPSEYSINQIIIKYGKDDNEVNRNLDYFSLTYYEDKLYDINRVALENIFSKECFVKITIKKMWTDLYDFRQGKCIDENIKEKLLSTLKIEFNNDAKEIMEYMLGKYKENVVTLEEITEKVTIGNYIINTYKTDATSLDFYIEKLSS